MFGTMIDVAIMHRFTRWLLALSPLRFALLSAVAAQTLRLPVAAVAMRLSAASPGALIRTDVLDLLNSGPFAAFLTVALLLTVVPLGETMACQWVPMRLLRPAGPFARVVGSAALFGYLHTLSPGPPAVLFAAAFIPGLLFAATLLRWESHGLPTAILSTTLAHAFTNLIALGALVIVARGGF